MQEASE